MQLLFRALKNWALQVHVAKDNSIVGDVWERNVWLISKLFVQDSSQSNCVSPKPSFPRAKAPPAKRERWLWGRKLPLKSIKSSGSLSYLRTKNEQQQSRTRSLTIWRGAYQDWRNTSVEKDNHTQNGLSVSIHWQFFLFRIDQSNYDVRGSLKRTSQEKGKLFGNKTTGIRNVLNQCLFASCP